MLTAEQILATSKPEKLFSSLAAVSSEFKSLMKQWHPDFSKDPKANEVSAHINDLFRQAQAKIKNHAWEVPGVRNFTFLDGTQHSINFYRSKEFELGEMFYHEKELFYEVRNDYADLVLTAQKIVKLLNYKIGPDLYSPKMPNHIFPHILGNEEFKGGKYVCLTMKKEDEWHLPDLLKIKGPLEAKHVAWIINRVYNIICYLYRHGINHNAICVENFFISPERHALQLYGGWWYSQNDGSQILALPATRSNWYPPELLQTKKSTVALDLKMVKVMGLELLGKDAPEPMLAFLRAKPSNDPVKDYLEWDTKVLPASFAERRFAKLDYNPSDILNLEK